jgi:hypothetical protein
VIDNLDDGRYPSLVGASAEENDAADLDQSPLARCDIGVTHFDVCSCSEALGRSNECVYRIPGVPVRQMESFDGWCCWRCSDLGCRSIQSVRQVPMPSPKRAKGPNYFFTTATATFTPPPPFFQRSTTRSIDHQVALTICPTCTVSCRQAFGRAMSAI